MRLQTANAGNRKRADDALAGHVTVVTRGEAQLMEVLTDAGTPRNHLFSDAHISWRSSNMIPCGDPSAALLRVPHRTGMFEPLAVCGLPT